MLARCLQFKIQRPWRALADLVDHPRDEVHVPKIAVLGLALRGLFPHTTDRMLLRALRRWHFDGKPEARNDGNLHESIGLGAVRGTRRPQVSTPASLGDAVLHTLGEMTLQPLGDTTSLAWKP